MEVKFPGPSVQTDEEILDWVRRDGETHCIHLVVLKWDLPQIQCLL